MLTAIFPDSCDSIINKNEYLLCINISAVIRHYIIISRPRKYNYIALLINNK